MPRFTSPDSDVHGGCCCKPSEKHRSTSKASLFLSFVEIAWISMASAAIDICPYRPVYSAASLQLFAALMAGLSQFCYGSCFTQNCFNYTNLFFVALAAFLAFIALCQVT